MKDGTHRIARLRHDDYIYTQSNWKILSGVNPIIPEPTQQASELQLIIVFQDKVPPAQNPNEEAAAWPLKADADQERFAKKFRPTGKSCLVIFDLNE